MWLARLGGGPLRRVYIARLLTARCGCPCNTAAGADMIIQKHGLKPAAVSYGASHDPAGLGLAFAIFAILYWVGFIVRRDLSDCDLDNLWLA